MVVLVLAVVVVMEVLVVAVVVVDILARVEDSGQTDVEFEA